MDAELFTFCFVQQADIGASGLGSDIVVEQDSARGQGEGIVFIRQFAGQLPRGVSFALPRTNCPFSWTMRVPG